ncbi:peptidoglycan DD-metalloendopeptidase family protein [Luteipulveratus flavus]|uniref:Peptidoglycan DD-metalloendopeptidase family protein n=1 Tax=Luteipulveratus flavus TaxID=3031728 RepID=A0ABT6C898_9MICO|nr:peptidoglycan DD-metalloendopeptidase family protein [Luteipulveratus sp. YIM 133296]MDF8263516.1 peptidoglycan DD-metalloendopeptidase family protein [Luteipulveratus sp. YIM 133296]
MSEQETAKRSTLLIAAAVVVSLVAFGPFGFLLMMMASTAAGTTVACENGYTTGNPATGAWRAPFQQAYTTTSPYGWRIHPITGIRKLHAGQDLVSQPGPGPVVAASAGTVVRSGWYGGLGNSVEIMHAGGVSTVYGHMRSIDGSMKEGAPVRIGQQIGIEGTTGASTGEHLHFEVHLNGHPTDPTPFMQQHGAPLDGRAIAPSPQSGDATAVPVAAPAAPSDGQGAGDGEGGGGFQLPPPGEPRQDSLHNKPLPIPDQIKQYYVNAANRYKVPWTLLAGVGMEETAHGRNNRPSSVGAQGLMQFMPATWESMGVDGDGDGKADINNDADSAMSAANYLTKSGAHKGAEGVRKAIFAYNHADWYVNDVLYYAQQYGGGVVPGDGQACAPSGANAGNPSLPPIDDAKIATVLRWAQSHVGDDYVMGANGPHTWDCSSFSQNAYAQIGVSMPRTAQSQRDWLARGNGFRVQPGQEKPGDLIFWDSYLGPNTIGHVMLVFDPAKQQTVEAMGSQYGVVYGSYKGKAQTKHIFEIWRVGQTKPQEKV